MEFVEYTPKKQAEFIEWLKEQKIYTSLDSASVMRRMFLVWTKLRDQQEQAKQAQISDLKQRIEKVNDLNPINSRHHHTITGKLLAYESILKSLER